MTIHRTAIEQPKKMLQNLATWLDQAASSVEDKSAEPDDFLTCRLAVDQFTLLRQIQSACDTAKFIGSRLGELEAPKHADDEKTFAEIKNRIAETVTFLDTVEPAALEGYAERKIVLPVLPEGKWARGEDYLNDFALPNFYFHLTNAYAILRHNGVSLGKRDYLGSITLQG
jgi:uncharacterized protein